MFFANHARTRINLSHSSYYLPNNFYIEWVKTSRTYNTRLILEKINIFVNNPGKNGGIYRNTILQKFIRSSKFQLTFNSLNQTPFRNINNKNITSYDLEKNKFYTKILRSTILVVKILNGYKQKCVRFSDKSQTYKSSADMTIDNLE